MRKITETIWDDFDHAVPAAEVVLLAVDDWAYVFDLSAESAARLREALAPFIGVGKRLGPHKIVISKRKRDGGRESPKARAPQQATPPPPEQQLAVTKAPGPPLSNLKPSERQSHPIHRFSSNPAREAYRVRVHKWASEHIGDVPQRLAQHYYEKYEAWCAEQGIEP